MIIGNLKDYKRGWLVGKFTPSLLQMDIEVGVQSYKKGDTHPRHVHFKAQEFNILLDGRCEFLINNVIMVPKRNDIILVEKGFSCRFKALTDCRLLVIKSKSVLDDKYIIEEY